MPDDSRATLDPEREIPNWFWDVIEEGQRDHERFVAVCQQLDRDRLFRFIDQYRGLASYFSGAPFTLFLRTGIGEGALEDLGFWIVSQGQAFVLHLWTHPEEFGDLAHRWLWTPPSQQPRMCDSSYGFIAEQVWEDRFGEEYPR